MEEKITYVKLRDESGSYWNPSLDVRLVRSVPGKLSEEIARPLIKKGVVVEITKEEYDRSHVATNAEKKEALKKEAELAAVRKSNYETIMTLAKAYLSEEHLPEAITEAKKAEYMSPEMKEEVDAFIAECEELQSKLDAEKEESDGSDTENMKLEIQNLIDEGIEKEVLTKKGSWFKLGDVTLGNGNDDTVEVLMTDVSLLNQLKDALTAVGGE